MITIYHNPACGTSRKVLELLRERGVEPKVVEYLKTPLSKKEIIELVKKMGVSVRALLRNKGGLYDEMGLADDVWTDDQLLDFIVEHPVLMNRPIVVTPKGAKLCRPVETVLELLPAA